MAKKAKQTRTGGNVLPLAESRAGDASGKGATPAAAMDSAMDNAVRSALRSTSGASKADGGQTGAPVSTPVGGAGRPAAIAEAAAAEARERRQEREGDARGDKGAFAGLVAAGGEADAEGEGADDGSILRKKEFIAEVARRSGLKKPDARRAIDAFLDVMSEGLKEGRTLALMPRAKIKPVRQTDAGNATVVTTKIRLKDVTVISDEGGLASPED
ncbi:DNA-binding protein [Brevirhabdus pacifica]|uniref:HU family DNA-binding protein n=2 Tax=Brevirhabdus pacifica TaxID=1267768 RepID=UPI0009F86DB7|nr:HU family DNA-binding protein [Brevirhabdus pacifica]PJJ85158.1 DNA-binding protein [Brevirhabdus pacifica]